MRSRSYLLGLGFLGPSLVLLFAFYIMPVVLTTVFAFTNMSTSTGISGGSYVISANLLRELGNRDDIDDEIVAALGETGFSVTAETVAQAAASGVPRAFVLEIETRLMGKSFHNARDFEAALKELPSRPTRVRDLKLATEPFKRSILNIRYSSREEMTSIVSSMVPEASAETVGEIADASYTGWRWTSSNFSTLIDRPETLRIVLNTAFYVVTTLVFTIVVGMFLAITTFYLPRTGATFFNALWLLPRITPVVLYAVMWKWMTWENGFLYVIADYFGLPAFNYMKGSVPTAWAIIILVNGFVGAALAMILFSGALRAIPIQQFWASEVDGASRWQQIRRIILPQLRWPIMFVTCYQTLSLLSSYEQIWLTTDGGPGSTTTVWALEAFKTALNNYTGNLQYGLGAAMALILVIVGLVLSILYLRMFRFNELVSKPKIEF